ncbi:MAG: hypothetical protein ACPGYL_01975 [Rhodospirillaceae bacterium]
MAGSRREFLDDNLGLSVLAPTDINAQTQPYDTGAEGQTLPEA